MVIGKGGETIRSLEADYEVQIDIEEDGTILVYATSGDEGRRRDRRDHRADQGPGGRRRVHRQGREDDRLRRVRRAEEGHRRAAARLERRPRPRQPHRGRDRARRRARRARPGGRQGPRPDRPQADPEARGRQARLARRSSSSGRRTPRRASPARSARAATTGAGAAAAAARAATAKAQARARERRKRRDRGAARAAPRRSACRSPARYDTARCSDAAPSCEQLARGCPGRGSMCALSDMSACGPRGARGPIPNPRPPWGRNERLSSSVRS